MTGSPGRSRSACYSKRERRGVVAVLAALLACIACIVVLESISAGLAAPPAPAGSAPKKSRPAARFGVVSFYGPRQMVTKYQPLVDYLSRHTEYDWELRLAPSYRVTVRDLCAGRIDLAYLGPFSYARAHAACGANPVVRLQTAGEPTYEGFVMVPDSSPIASLAGLRGKTLAAAGTLSTSSHLAPRQMLSRAGLVPCRDVPIRYFANHEQAARAVLVGEADACAVRDLVGQRFAERGLRVLARTGPIPNFPLVLSPVARRGLDASLLRVLVDLPRKDPSVAAEMAHWDPELAGGFVPASDAEYDAIRAMAHDVFGPSALTDPEDDLTCPGSGR